MPTYHGAGAPTANAVYPGTPIKLFGASATYPGSPYAPAADGFDTLAANARSQAAHIPSPVAAGPNVTPNVSLTWQTKFGTAPSAVSVSLQGSNVDMDGSYATIDTSTNVAGESRTLTAQAYKFFRAIVNSVTGGSGIEVILTLTGQ